ncbi:alpha/beta fold hydrolase [Granulicella sibirica]|uniref:Dipeptidyl peptidase IV n=1 Tax=Granulicella sibirica TaxID=2479048 RepID=A0A4Q0SV19_9BACT|nr:alpha/beta fold hydrolase [Granulicella sibirica]RXH54895.1 Dipeptidyl peptidase IV [Granulicella sibirica]
MFSFRRAVVLLCLTTSAAFAQAPADPANLTVDAVNREPYGYPPLGGQWSPDGKVIAYLYSPRINGISTGKPGDIIAVSASTGKVTVLAPSEKLDALGSAAINEKDRDHRDRYGMSSFLWAPDSKHLLLDKGGILWLYDIASGTGQQIVDTHSGSGDDPKFSPDARSVSYLRDHNLYVHPVAGDTPKETALTTSGNEALLNGELDWVYLEELDARSNYFWSPDSKSIAYLQMNEEKVPQYPIQDFIPTHSTLDQQRYPQPGDPNPIVRVGIAPVSGGQTKWIEVPQSPGNDYIPRFGWINPSTLYIDVLTRDQKHLNLYFADATSGKVKLVYTDTDPKYLNFSSDITLLPHGRFLAPSWRDGHTHIYLYQYDEEHSLDREAKLVRQLTSGDYEVQSISAPSTTTNGSAETVLYTSTEGSPLDQNLWSISLDGTNKHRITTGPGYHNPDVSPDGTHFVEFASDFKNITPPRSELCDTASFHCDVFWTMKAFGPIAGVTTDIVTLKAADGVTKIYGYLTQPSKHAGKASTPLILNPYGGPTPSAGITNAWPGRSVLFDSLLAQHGFAVLQVDNRGSGGRGRDFQQAAYQDFGAVQFSDQIAALDQVLAKNPQFDPKRLGWWGWSWGGTFTLYAMTHSDRFRAGVAVAPGTDYRNYDSIYVERYLGLPAQNPAVYKAAAVNESAANLKGRVLIAQGTGDDNVHMQNTIQFLQPLITAGIPYDLQLFPRLTHSIAGLPARNALFNRIVFQFETYLKPPVKP